MSLEVLRSQFPPATGSTHASHDTTHCRDGLHAQLHTSPAQHCPACAAAAELSSTSTSSHLWSDAA
jgi:hypothetical protein